MQQERRKAGDAALPALRPFSSPRVVVLAIAVTALLLVVFQASAGRPSASRYFFVAADCPAQAAAGTVCGGFPATGVRALVILREILHALPAILAVLVAYSLFLGLRARMGWLHPRNIVHVVALATLILGPVLLVNVGLKGYAARPRPYATDVFGGNLPFVAAGDFGGQCTSNCSFVSGEAAAGFWLICLVPLVSAGWRRRTAIAASMAAVVCGALRLAFGAHYLSDIVMAGAFTLAIFCVCAYWAERWAISRNASASSDSAEHAL